MEVGKEKERGERNTYRKKAGQRERKTEIDPERGRQGDGERGSVTHGGREGGREG